MLHHKIAAAVLIMAQATLKELTSKESSENPFTKSFEQIKTHRSVGLSTMASDEISQIRVQLIEIKSKQLVEIRNRLESSQLSSSDEEHLRTEYKKLKYEIQELKALKMG